MPRSPEEQRRRAQKYGRRHRLYLVWRNRKELDAMVATLVAELRSSSVPAAEVTRLIAELRKHTDDKRRNAAIWAIVDALESAGP